MSRRRFLLGASVAMAAGPLAVLVPVGSASALAAGTKGPPHGPQINSVPVLAYHQLDNTPDVESISSAMFHSNMAHLRSAGYNTISARNTSPGFVAKA